MVEQPAHNRLVVGSIPTGPTCLRRHPLPSQLYFPETDSFLIRSDCLSIVAFDTNSV